MKIIVKKNLLCECYKNNKRLSILQNGTAEPISGHKLSNEINQINGLTLDRSFNLIENDTLRVFHFEETIEIDGLVK